MALLDDFLGGSGTPGTDTQTDTNTQPTTDVTTDTTTDTTTDPNDDILSPGGGSSGTNDDLLDDFLGGSGSPGSDGNTGGDTGGDTGGQTNPYATVVNTIYQEVLLRDAETSGLNYWSGLLEQGALTQNEMRFWLLTSSEYTNAVAPIQNLYSTLLERDADAGGLNFWVDSLRGGVTLEEIAARFVQGAEFTGLNLTDTQAIARLEAALGYDLQATTLEGAITSLIPNVQIPNTPDDSNSGGGLVVDDTPDTSEPSTPTTPTTPTTPDTGTTDTTDTDDLLDDFLGGSGGSSSGGSVTDATSDATTDSGVITDTTTDTSTDTTTDTTTDTGTDEPTVVDGDAATATLNAATDNFVYEFEQKSVQVTINGFGEDDTIRFLDGVIAGDVNVQNTAFNDGELVLLVGELEIYLTGLSSDLANNADSFMLNVGGLDFA